MENKKNILDELATVLVFSVSFGVGYWIFSDKESKQEKLELVVKSVKDTV